MLHDVVSFSWFTLLHFQFQPYDFEIYIDGWADSPCAGYKNHIKNANDREWRVYADKKNFTKGLVSMKDLYKKRIRLLHV